MSIIDFLPEVKGQYRENADLAKVTWFQVGGKAEVLFKPSDEEDLAYFLSQKPSDVPVTIIGVGSNLLVRDGGIEGVVIRLGRHFAQVDINGENIVAGAGCLDVNVARFAMENSLAGLEFLVGIPGTVGGALAMNAGAYEKELKDVLVSAEAVDREGVLQNFTVDELRYSYRHSPLADGLIFTKAIFKCSKGDAKEISAKMDKISNARETTQPVRTRTGGSTFKNPPGKKAWQLIDEAGCRGLKVGGAQVSEMHCNFLINTGNATASDLENLGEEVRRRVKEKSGVELEWEIKRIGKAL